MFLVFSHFLQTVHLNGTPLDGATLATPAGPFQFLLFPPRSLKIENSTKFRPPEVTG
jgi:hypothetical protein